MHRPIAGLFQGSMPVENMPEAALARQVDLSFGTTAILASLSVWAGAYGMMDRPDLPMVLGISCVALLVPAVLGLWILRQVNNAPQAGIIRLYDRILQRLAQHGPRAVAYPPTEGGFGGIADLVSELANSVRTSHAGRERSSDIVTRRGEARASGRQEAGVLASQMQADAASITETVTVLEATTPRLNAEIAAASETLGRSEAAMGRAADAVVEMTQSVRNTTAEAGHMTAVGVSLAEAAHAAHQHVAALDSKTAAIEQALAPVVKAVATLGQAARRAAPGTLETAIDFRWLVETCGSGLESAISAIRALTVEASAANCRVMELTDLNTAYHLRGHTISAAVQQQGQDIERVLQELYEARSGFTALRAGVEAIEQSSTLHGAATSDMLNAMQVLPARADNLAKVLRGIPDFAPPEF